MNTTNSARVALACLGALLCCSVPAHAKKNDGWDWMVAPYGWASSVGTDLETRRPPSPSSTDMEFNDVIDKLDGAFQVHAEGQGDKFGVFADFTYIGLADSRQLERFSTASDLDTRLFEAAAVWSPGSDRYHGLDLFAGLRYIDVDFTSRLTPVSPSFDTVRVDESKSFSDLMLGVRYTWDLSQRWGLTLRGDGSFGDTEGTWNASVVTNYRTNRGAWFFGYRYFDASVEAGDANLDITMSGPAIGYGFKF